MVAFGVPELRGSGVRKSLIRYQWTSGAGALDNNAATEAQDQVYKHRGNAEVCRNDAPMRLEGIIGSGLCRHQRFNAEKERMQGLPLHGLS